MINQQTPIVRDFYELRHGINVALLMHTLTGREQLINFTIDEFLAEDPHTIMYLAWVELITEEESQVL